MDRSFEAVLFDWRGTLVATSTLDAWVREALRRLDRPMDEGVVDDLVGRLDGAGDVLDGPGVDCDAALHRHVHRTVFADLGIDDELAGTLYAVESIRRTSRGRPGWSTSSPSRSSRACRNPIRRC